MTEISQRIEKIENVLRRIAARYSYDQHDADDIYGEIVVNILEHSSPTESNSRIYTRAHWAGQHHVSRLQTIGKYVVQDYDEGEAGESEEDQGAGVLSCATSGMSTEDLAISQELASKLQAVIGELPEQYREIVGLMYVGASQVEIAQKLGVTPPAINQRLKTVRALFQNAGLSPSFG